MSCYCLQLFSPSIYWYRYVDDYRLCCEFAASSPNFLLPQCQTTEIQPPLNLCGSLMRNALLRVSIWGLGLGALIGNAVVILWRTKPKKKAEGHTMNVHTEKPSHSVLVLNLAISDYSADHKHQSLSLLLSS